MVKIIVQDASIKTAAVEIQTLKIAGKQVTLSVFRQLQEKQVIDENGDLRGPVWGLVNYHPDKCADSREHIHVIWQDRENLYRSRIDKLSTIREKRAWIKDQNVLQCLMLKGLLEAGNLFAYVLFHELDTNGYYHFFVSGLGISEYGDRLFEETDIQQIIGGHYIPVHNIMRVFLKKSALGIKGPFILEERCHIGDYALSELPKEKDPDFPHIRYNYKNKELVEMEDIMSALHTFVPLTNQEIINLDVKKYVKGGFSIIEKRCSWYQHLKEGADQLFIAV